MRFSFLALCLFAALPSPPQAAAPVPTGIIEDARLVSISGLKGELFHVQGIDLDGQSLWVTSVDLERHRGFLHQFDRATGALIRRIELTDGARFHPGGITVHGNAIWVPVAEMKANSSAVIEKIDKRSLTIERRIPVADHIGCVALAGRFLIAGNWDSRLFYVLDEEGRQLRIVRNPFPTRYQDIKFVDGRLVASGLLTSADGTVDWIAWPSMQLVASRHAGAADSGKAYTSEGMALKGRDLYLLPEDGPSRLFHFQLGVQ